MLNLDTKLTFDIKMKPKSINPIHPGGGGGKIPSPTFL